MQDCEGSLGLCVLRRRVSGEAAKAAWGCGEIIQRLELRQQDLYPFQPYSDSTVVNLEITIHRFQS